MNTTLECIPCLVRQSLEAAQLVSDDPVIHESIVREILEFLSGSSYALTPPEIAAQVHERIRRTLYNADPYREQKRLFNDMALGLFDQLRREIDRADDPFGHAVHLAIAGNVIDFGVNADISEDYVGSVIGQVAQKPLSGNLEQLRLAASSARTILYLADNTGEIVLDRLLIERLPRGTVTVAVRGGPILNDATMEDAVYTGLTDLVRVIPNGSTIPGTSLSRCSDEFRELFGSADLIIAKGQGNFETLESDRRHPIFHLFRVKCPVAARLCGYPLGSHVVLSSQSGAR